MDAEKVGAGVVGRTFGGNYYVGDYRVGGRVDDIVGIKTHRQRYDAQHDKYESKRKCEFAEIEPVAEKIEEKQSHPDAQKYKRQHRPTAKSNALANHFGDGGEVGGGDVFEVVLKVRVGEFEVVFGVLKFVVLLDGAFVIEDGAGVVALLVICVGKVVIEFRRGKTLSHNLFVEFGGERVVLVGVGVVGFLEKRVRILVLRQTIDAGEYR